MLKKATDIGGKAFRNCTNLETIYIPQATSFSGCDGCTNLKTVFAPTAKSITTDISSNATIYCTERLTGISFPEEYSDYKCTIVSPEYTAGLAAAIQDGDKDRFIRKNSDDIAESNTDFMHKHCSSYAMLNGNTYVTLDRDILKIDSRFDFLIINESIITSNIKLLQTSFGFDKYICNEAEKTISIISELDIVSDTEKIFAFSDKQKLTNAKKLLKAKNSPVLNMEKDELINGLKKHPRYKDKFQFKDKKIVINSQKDVNELIKMLNDDIVRSELTNREYDSSTKYMALSIKVCKFFKKLDK